MADAACARVDFNLPISLLTKRALKAAIRLSLVLPMLRFAALSVSVERLLSMKGTRLEERNWKSS